MRMPAFLSRRVPALAVALVTVVVGSAAVPATAHAVPGDLASFGLHVPYIANGGTQGDPTVPMGTVRIWDVGVTWGKVQPSAKKFWWTGLDRAIQNAQRQNAKVLYVLGSTPNWAAKNPKQGSYPNKGAASMPKNMTLWKNWVTAVAKRYRNSIDAYQIWNEANLSTFWQGSPDQMAAMTAEAAKIIRKYAPGSQIVSASTTTRLESAYNKFFPKYLAGLKKRGWPVTVYSVHTYPNSLGTPASRDAAVAMVRASLAQAGAPAKPLWDTEINYGLAGPGAAYPKQTIDGDQATAWIAQTYLDSVRLGIDRTYWYMWTPPNPMLGIQLYTGTAASVGYQSVYNWLSAGPATCATGPVNTCVVVANGVPATIAWSSNGDAPFVVPDGATVAVTASNVSTPVTAGTPITIGSMPTWFGAN